MPTLRAELSSFGTTPLWTSALWANAVPTDHTFFDDFATNAGLLRPWPRGGIAGQTLTSLCMEGGRNRGADHKCRQGELPEMHAHE
jgi:hypothetical protein